MLTLAIDCSTSRGSVAIGQAATPESACTVLWERIFPAGRGHGGELFASLQEGWQAALNVADGSRRERLEKIVVGLGPGSYSGVRQAIAVAVGLSLATGAALVGVSSVLALEGIDAGISCHVTGDARRGTFYYAAVSGNRLLHGPELLDGAAALLEKLAVHPEWPVLATESVPASLPAGVTAAAVLPLASRLLAVSASLHENGPLEPIYLRPPSVTMPRAAAS